MKTRKFFNIAAILVLLSIICIFTACKEEEEIIEVKSGGTLIVANSSSYTYFVRVYFGTLVVFSSSLPQNDSIRIPSNKDVSWMVLFNQGTSDPGFYQRKSGSLEGGEEFFCSIP